MSFVYLRRTKDGQIVDVPSEQVEETLKRGGFELIGEIVQKQQEHVETKQVEVTSEFNCILCGFVGKNAQSLRMHRQKAHA